MKEGEHGANDRPFLFVYGTLMRGLHAELDRKIGAKFVGNGTITGKLYDLGEFPGAKLADGSKLSVKGELYRLSDPERATRILDKYEDYFPSEPHKSLFVRELVAVTLEEGRRQRAWTYLYNRPVNNARLIPGGDYREYAAHRWS